MNTINSMAKSLEEQLHEFVEKKDQKNVEKLLAKGANATLINSGGRSAIGDAVLNRDKDILTILLKSCNEPPITSITPECSRMNRSASMTVITSPASEQRDDDTFTPDGMENLQWEEEIQGNVPNSSDDEWSKLYIYYAKMIEKTGLMLANTIKVKDPHCLDTYGNAPIHYAVIIADLEILTILLNFESPVNICTRTGLTPLHLGIYRTDIVRLLLKYGADPNKQIYETNDTPLHGAAEYGFNDVVLLLIESGADINATNAIDRTPLICALAKKEWTVAQMLIDYGAKINIEDGNGMTPLFIAAMLNDIPMTEYLLQNGARRHAEHFLLHKCIEHGMSQMVQLLIAWGENPNLRRNNCGQTPLQLAIVKRNLDIVEYLLDCGAEQQPNHDTLGELQAAVQECKDRNEFVQYARRLLCAGANINAENMWNTNPLDSAITMGKYQFAEYLIKEGANITHLKITDLNLLKLAINAGLKMNYYHRPIWLPIDVQTTNEDNCDDYMKMIHTNAMSLQQLSRIKLRTCIIDRIKCNNQMICATPRNSKWLEPYSYSIFKYYLSKLGLPQIIQRYIYDFPDVPTIDSDTDRSPIAYYSYGPQHFLIEF